ncbi:zinc finger, CCHC-type containing protein [Tanacetum coccineum]
MVAAAISMVSVPTTPIPEDGSDDATNVKSSKELWDSLEAKYMADDALSKKFLGSCKTPDLKLKTLGERGIECIIIGYVEHSKAFRFSSVPRPSLRIPNGNEDIGGSVVPEEVAEEVVQQPELELRKSKRNRTPKNFGPEFQLYLIEGTRDEKEAINDEMDSIIGNNTWVLADLPPGCKPLGCKWIFKRKLKVDC